jgi:hypothetical protein
MSTPDSLTRRFNDINAKRTEAMGLRRNRIEQVVADLIPEITTAHVKALLQVLAKQGKPNAQLWQEGNQRLLAVRRRFGLFSTDAYTMARDHLQMALRADLDTGLIEDASLKKLADLIVELDAEKATVQAEFQKQQPPKPKSTPNPAPAGAPSQGIRNATNTAKGVVIRPAPVRGPTVPASAASTDDSMTDLLIYGATGLPTSGRTLLLDALDIGPNQNQTTTDNPSWNSEPAFQTPDPAANLIDIPIPQDTQGQSQDNGFGGQDFATGGGFGGDAPADLPSFNDTVSASVDSDSGYYS